MDIDRTNFDSIKEQFLKEIENAEMISLDLEFSGIKTDEKLSRTDTPIERYKKCYKIAKRYTIIQIGISIFRPKENE